MSLNFFNRYPARFDAVSTEYPQGKFRNLSAPNVQDGSYLEQDWLNDHNGFFGALLRKAGLTPNGNVDTALSSQYYDALVAVINTVSPKLVVTQTTGQSTTSVISQKGFTDANNKKWDVQQTVGNGNVMRSGAYGLGGKPIQDGYLGDNIQFWRAEIVPNVNAMTYGYGLTFRTINNSVFADIWFKHNDAEKVYFRSNDAYGTYKEGEFKTTINTTIDPNGFIKNASPIVHLFSDHIEHNDQFKTAPKLEKLGVGIYKITGTLGLAEGLTSGDWYIELPKDRYGKPYFNVEYERLDDGVVLRVYERIELYVPSTRKITDRDGNPVEVKERLVLNGDLIDIKEEWRCIDLRFKEK